jgi:hypothetical protein
MLEHSAWHATVGTAAVDAFEPQLLHKQTRVLAPPTNAVLTAPGRKLQISARRATPSEMPTQQGAAMTSSLVRNTIALAALCVAYPAPAHESDGAGGKLGAVDFKVGCNAAAQREFNLAMAYYHSFAFEQMSAPLDRTLQADPSCGMVHWARAMASLNNPFGWPDIVSAKALSEGPELIERARKAGLGRQAVRQPAQGREAAGAGLQAAARTSRRRALPDPQLRLPAAGRAGAGRRAAL